MHVFAAVLAVGTGAAAAFAHKGTPCHVRIGRWYYRAVRTVCVTAVLLTALRPRQDYYLTIIGLIAFAAATVGYQHRRRCRPGDTPHIAGMGLSYIAMLTAFYVDNGRHLPVWDRLPAFAFWLLPSVIGIPITARAIHHAKSDIRMATTRRDGAQ
ncbi:MAG: DUF2306 domain-containing protein [bacterium]